MTDAAHDSVVTIGLVVAFAALVTIHLATLFGLLRARRWLLALGALVFPPLAPYWALTRGMRARGVVWLASAAVYVVMFVAAR